MRELRAYNINMNNTQDQLEALVEAAFAGYRACTEDTEHAWTRLANAEEDAYRDIMDGGYGDIEYESDEFLQIVIRRIVDLADELGLSI